MLMTSRTRTSSNVNIVDTEIIQSYVRKKQSYLTIISIYFKKEYLCTIKWIPCIAQTGILHAPGNSQRTE